MIDRQILVDKIIVIFSILKSKVEISNPLNFTDVNIVSENFYRDLLNLIYGYKLINLNELNTNAAGIDLGDEENSICFQVTSTSAIAKTRKTVSGFIKNKWHEKYDRLVILNIAKKADHTEKLVGTEGVYQLDTTTDIWDISDMMKTVNGLQPKQLDEIYQFLKSETRFTIDPTVAKEIETFLKLIEILSDESQPRAGTGFIEAPDPDGKINKRFAEHSKFLTEQFQELYMEYGPVLAEVYKQAEIGPPRFRRLGLYLKVTSDKVLSNNGNNPQLALDALVNQYTKMISDAGLAFDESAVRFFLIEQLIRCNVFPNKSESI